MMNQIIFLGADHNGFALKNELKKYLANKNFIVHDLGNTKLDKNDDYIDYAKKVAQAVKKNKSAMGILVCGSGQGMCMAANRTPGIRAAIGYSLNTTKHSRQDENSNVLCLAAWDLSKNQALKITAAWLATSFSNLPRHKRRLKKLD